MRGQHQAGPLLGLARCQPVWYLRYCESNADATGDSTGWLESWQGGGGDLRIRRSRPRHTQHRMLPDHVCSM